MKRISFVVISVAVFAALLGGVSFGSNLAQGLTKSQAGQQDFFVRNARNETCLACGDQSERLKADSSLLAKDHKALGFQGSSVSAPWLCSTRASEKKLIASDTGLSDGLGASSGIFGDYAIIGAPFHQHAGMNKAGAAYIFRKQGNIWVPESEILEPGGGAYDDEFGASVSIFGNYAIVGAPLYGTGPSNNDRGVAYIFKRDGTTWSLQQILYGSNLQEWDRYGISVSIDGDYAAVGSDLGTGTSSNSGNVHIFKRNGTSWNLEAIIFGNDAYGSCGHSVSISGDYVVMGAPYDNDSGANSGSAYVFKREGTNWIQQAKLIAADAAAGDYFGNSVSIYGDTVIVGAFGNSDAGLYSGSAYIFKRNGMAWTQEQKVVAPDAAAYDQFGDSVSVSENYAAIGAPNRYRNSTLGGVYIFKRNTTSWSHKTTFTATDSSIKPYFGQSVAVSEDLLTVGASDASFNTAGPGAAYYYKICSGPEYMAMD